MGGTFDPIHHGHLVAASEVASVFDLDEVVFVPTGQPWQKADREVSPGRAPLPHDGHRDRLEPAVHGQPGRHRPPAARPTPSTPCATSRVERPDAELFFITGADALAQILSWKDAEELFGLAHFVGVTRPGHQLDRRRPAPRTAVSLLEVPAMAISSTDCRARVRRRRARSGTSCRTGSCSTSPSTACTAGRRCPRERGHDRDCGPGRRRSRGERRRALEAERERQAQREAERERQAQLEAGGPQPEEQAPPTARPYAVTLPGQEASVLVSDARQASEADGVAVGPPADAGLAPPTRQEAVADLADTDAGHAHTDHP